MTNIAATIAHVIKFTGLEIATRRTFKKTRISLLTRIDVADLSPACFAPGGPVTPALNRNEGISSSALIVGSRPLPDAPGDGCRSGFRGETDIDRRWSIVTAVID
ncbi:MAG TPA: hypothetical protein VK749_13235 [Xanthobacteraceae bacterium]|nr:hypothetical protein [Xanthobacteraceae bacterium]